MSNPFSSDELQRYSQQIKLDQIGLIGQEKLKKARVLCIGLGGLGSPAALYLAGAGIGTLGIVDGDRIDKSNLQRQVLYRSADVHQHKAMVAKEALLALNPSITVHAYPVKITPENAIELITQYDIIVDGSDNFSTRYLIHDHCYQLAKPYVFASVYQFQGHCSVFTPESPCLRCLFPYPASTSPRCEEGGVLGVLPGLLGIIQATEVLKYVLSLGNSLEKRLLIVDLLTMNMREITLVKNPNCEFCSVEFATC